MAVPSVLGLPVSDNNDNTATVVTQAFTIASGTDALVATIGSFDSGATISITSVTLDGNAMTLVAGAFNGSADNGSWMYYMSSSDANWPGTGPFNVEYTLAGNIGAFQKRWGVFALQDVDTSNEIDGANAVLENSQTSFDVTGLASTTNDLAIAASFHFPGPRTSDAGDAEIVYEDTGGGDLYVFSNTASASTTSIGHALGASSSGVIAAGIFRGTSAALTASGTPTLPALTMAGSATLNAASLTASGTPTLPALTMAGSATLNALALTASGALTLPALTMGGSGFLDTFGGSGDLDPSWIELSPTDLPDVTQTSGRYRANLQSNTSDITLWFNAFRGRADYQAVTFPFEIIALNVGIGTVGDSQTAPPTTSTPILFCALNVNFGTLATNEDWSQLGVGHRGSDATFTLEGKNTISNSSSVTDEGTNAAPLARADLRVVGESNSLTWYYREPGDVTWILYNGTGDLPGTEPTFPDDVFVGLVTYAQNTTGVPFVGTCDSFQILGEDSATAILSRKVEAANLDIPALTMAGSATLNTVLTASGALSIPALTMAGSAVLKKSASGAITLPSVIMSGQAEGPLEANGAILMPSISMSGTATLNSISIWSINPIQPTTWTDEAQSTTTWVDK